MAYSKATKAGIALAHQFKWNGDEICEAFLAALTDANFHTLAGELKPLIDAELDQPAFTGAVMTAQDERFAPGYTQESAAYEQATRPKMFEREYALIVATMKALSPYWIDADMLNKVAPAIEAIRPEFSRGKFLEAVES